MAYIESITFGGGGVSLKGKTAAKEYFIGANYSTSSVLVETSAKDAGGIDTGNDKGMYRLLYDCAIRCVAKIAVSKATDITFTLYESADNNTFTAGSVWTTKIAKVNEARRTPVSFPLPSTTARYIVLSIKLSGGSATTSDSITEGMLVMSAQPASY